MSNVLDRTAREIDTALLDAGDPPAFSIINQAGTSPVIFIADHAGRAIPRRLNRLGLDEPSLLRHIAWDIGIEDLTRHLSSLLDATAILGGYSRLVIDYNRKVTDPTSIPPVSDGVVVPGNQGLADRDRQARIAACFTPYHTAIEQMIDKRCAEGRIPAVISMHSFTPVMRGFQRPWHIGVLWNRDPRLPVPFMAHLHKDTTLCVGDNEPYTGRDQHGYSMHYHAERRGLPHLLIEIRQDLIDTPVGAEQWAHRLAEHLEAVLADPDIYRQVHY